MSARQKLTVASLNGALVIAALTGLVAERWAAFWIVLVVAVVRSVHVGDIWPWGRP